MSFWVIEFIGRSPRLDGQTHYECIRDVDDPSRGFMDWTPNIDEALQFSRKIDAERWARVFHWADDSVDVREHAYMSDTPAESKWELIPDEHVQAIREAIRKSREDINEWRRNAQPKPLRGLRLVGEFPQEQTNE